MGGLIGSIFDLIGGDPAQEQENQLEALGGYESGVGKGLTTAGAQFDESILSGDPTKMASALAPEISTGQQQVQQARNNDAQFAPRSGGTAASTAGAEAANRANIINLEGGLQQGAAGQALSAGGNLLSQSNYNINDVANLKTSRRQAQVGDVNGIGQAAASIATMGMTGGMNGEMPMGGGSLNPEIANYRENNGPAPDFTNWNIEDSTQPDLSMFG